MNQLLSNKTFVIIGGTTGIGLSTAESFISEGANVVVVGRNSNNVDKAKSTLGKSASGLTGDATRAETAVKAIDLATKKFIYHIYILTLCFCIYR